jgi:uncharacterized repeat protein (TIGR01451 family)
MKNRAKTLEQWKWIGLGLLMLTGLLSLITPPSAWAVGTAAGTIISNQATINYQVGGVGQTPVLSDGDAAAGVQTTDFVVDRMVDLTVAEANGTYTDVSPGATAQVVTFTVSNTGNATLDFDLSAVVNLANLSMGPFGDQDTLDVTIVDAYVDSDGAGPTGGATPYDSSAHTFNAAADTDTFIDDLAQDQMINVYVVVTIPAAAVDGNIAGVILTALAQNTDGSALVQTAGADTTGVDTVFADAAGDADAARDARHSDTDAFRVLSAVLTVSKTSLVVEDPVNGTTNPKAIPGAYVEYTITVTNAGGAGATATSVIFADDLGTEIGNGTLAFRADSYGAGLGINVTAPDINGGAATNLSNAGDGDSGDFGATTADTVTVNCGDLDTGESAVITFQVVVQ